ncbi:hypothetical protein CLV56_3677 [Mumia flava]|uniref:DUF8094 domain-containing protein n=1 Tax=Mumia flava TaxID=1348852 RepID=A0A0B2BW35_9ACTN|nr:hypothetical protein [Mumia flava]PJJ54173.1 hypothetical protein CLV56_3677 [Mumia flava]
MTAGLRSRPVRLGALALAVGVLAAALAGCGVVPVRKDAPAGKIAAAPDDVDSISGTYEEAREFGMAALDAETLALVEGGSMLAIDTGAIQVARLLNGVTATGSGTSTWETEEQYTPRLDAYPLWFVTIAADDERSRRQLRVFSRPSAVAPWRLVAGPETFGSTALPEPAVTDGALDVLDADDGAGLAASPQEALDDYAAALDADAAPGEAATDSFVQQMRRQEAALLAEHPGLGLERSWAVQPDLYAFRTREGGALVVGTLLRQDAYTLRQGAVVRWPDDSEQRAHLGDPMGGPGVLRYYHEVLMYVPPQGDSGTPRVIGQYGGVVGRADGDGQAALVPPAPTETAPGETPPAPGETAPAPGETAPAPGETAPAPGETAPAPAPGETEAPLLPGATPDS